MSFTIEASSKHTPDLYTCLENAICFYISDTTLSTAQLKNILKNEFKITIGDYKFIDGYYMYPIIFETEQDYTYFLLRWL